MHPTSIYVNWILARDTLWLAIWMVLFKSRRGNVPSLLVLPSNVWCLQWCLSDGLLHSVNDLSDVQIAILNHLLLCLITLPFNYGPLILMSLDFKSYLLLDRAPVSKITFDHLSSLFFSPLFRSVFTFLTLIDISFPVDVSVHLLDILLFYINQSWTRGLLIKIVLIILCSVYPTHVIILRRLIITGIAVPLLPFLTLPWPPFCHLRLVHHAHFWRLHLLFTAFLFMVKLKVVILVLYHCHCLFLRPPLFLCGMMLIGLGCRMTVLLLDTFILVSW